MKTKFFKRWKTKPDKAMGRTATHGQPASHAQIATHEATTAHSRASVHSRKPAMLLCLAVTLLTSGCGLAQGDFSLAREELSSSRDRLSGIYVTENYIEPTPSQLEYNDRGEITFKPQETEKIYGIFNGYSAETLISFPGLEGYGFYSLMLPEDESHEAARCNTCDPVFTDLHITVSDGEETMEASLYVTFSDSGFRHYYFHPVYQQEDGQFYLLPGSGISSDSAEGLHFSHSIAESVSHTENGDETTSGYRFTVTIISEESPEKPELLFLNDSDQVTGRLSSQELDALLQADVPELPIPEDTACVILKQTKASGTDYTAYDPDNEYLEYKEAHGDGPLYLRQLRLIWP